MGCFAGALIENWVKANDKKSNLKTNSLSLRIGGIAIVVAVTLFANSLYIYIFGLFIMGTIVTGENYLLDLVKEWRTTTTRTEVLESPPVLDNKKAK